MISTYLEIFFILIVFSLIIVGVAYSVGAFDKPESTSKLSPKPTEPEPMSNDKLNPIIFHILNLLGMSSFIALITISSSTVQISSEFYLIEWGARSILYLVIIFPIIYVINYLTSNIFFYEAEIFPHILLLNFLLILNASPLFYILALVLGIIHYFKLRGDREKEIERKKDNQVKLTNEISQFDEFIDNNEAKPVSSLDNKIDVLETEIEELEKVNEKKLKIKELEKKLKDLKNSD